MVEKAPFTSPLERLAGSIFHLATAIGALALSVFALDKVFGPKKKNEKHEKQ